MNLYGNIVQINTPEIIGVVRRALSKVDSRLIDHGERVGYIAKCIYDVCDNKSDIDFTKLFVLCALHDIGAYKTDEIDNMVRFETQYPFKHALYGYLFLKNTTHLSEFADVIMYHHTDYADLKKINNSCSQYAEIIFLADRADILLHTPKSNMSILKNMAGTQFNPYYVDRLFEADKKYDVFKNISSGEYVKTMEECVSSLDIKSGEVMDYLRLLVYAIDFRSPYTVTHTADTTIISMETGKLLGADEQQLQMLYIGAFLHDIGKIAIPCDILEKPGKLTDDEFTAIKRHINEGEEILRGIVSDEICDIALRHHEKLDGSGYIYGLSADNLTLPQRIVAVSDVLSALSQERSYKPAFPKEKVISILTDMKDKGLLCPLVIDTVCSNYDIILEKTAKSHNPVKLLYTNLINEYKELAENFSKINMV